MSSITKSFKKTVSAESSKTYENFKLVKTKMKTLTKQLDEF